MLFFIVFIFAGALIADAKQCYKCHGSDCNIANSQTEKVDCYEKGACIEMNHLNDENVLMAYRDCIYDKDCDDLKSEKPGGTYCQICHTQACNWHDIP